MSSGFTDEDMKMEAKRDQFTYNITNILEIWTDAAQISELILNHSTIQQI